MFISERILRKEIIEVCYKIWLKGYVAAADGNVSSRLGEDRIIITPSGFSKGELKEEDLIITDMKGNKILGKWKTSSEIHMHLSVYNERKDVLGIVHAHPPTCIAFSIAGIELPECILPEVVVTLGKIPITEYATPGTPEGAIIVKDLIKEYDALILDRHGTITVGTSVKDAYYKLEKVEHTAEITMKAKQLGGIRSLSKDQIDKLIEVRKSLGLKERPIKCSNCGNCLSEKDIEYVTTITKHVIELL